MASERLRNYIGGEWVGAETENSREVRNPATGDLLAEVPLSEAEDVDRAARTAREAYRSWRQAGRIL